MVPLISEERAFVFSQKAKGSLRQQAWKVLFFILFSGRTSWHAGS